MSHVRAEAAANLKISGETMKLRVDAKATMEPLEKGDRVWLYNPQRKKGLSPKLSSPWDGPFFVTEKLSSVTYRIQKGKHSAPKVVHFNRLWKSKGPPKFTWEDGPGTGGASSPTSDVPDNRREDVGDHSHNSTDGGGFPEHSCAWGGGGDGGGGWAS